MNNQFETKLSDLEAIVSKLEDGQVPLETALELFEQGVKHAATCQKLLTKTEQKVQILLEKNQKLISQDFEPDE